MSVQADTSSGVNRNRVFCVFILRGGGSTVWIQYTSFNRNTSVYITFISHMHFCPFFHPVITTYLPYIQID
jgi:hypothetical protein